MGMITLTVLAVVWMIAGMLIGSDARRGSLREFVGAVMVLTPVMLIPFAAALSALRGTT